MTEESPDFFSQVAAAQRLLDQSFSTLPPYAPASLDQDAQAILLDVARRMQDNFPYAHPLYAGQMLKPPHPIARAAYTLALSVNPNNHALDGGRASSALEIEAVAAIAAMFGLGAQGDFLGHLTSGGTFANLEALWVAGQLAQLHIDRSQKPPAIAASAQAHYTHSRICGVLNLPFVSVPVDSANRMDVAALERMLNDPAQAPISTVVVTLGTTATGAVDPLDRILALRPRYGFRIHVDAAYGGYFTLAANLAPEARAAYDAIPHADSIVVDPHKHGLQPYGCGCVLFADPSIGRLYKHDSPYTYFTSSALHLGEISLECSRAGASAVALWSTIKLLPLTPEGRFAQGLERGRQTALELYRRLAHSPLFAVPSLPPQLDIVVWAVRAETPAQSSHLAQAVFDHAARLDLHLALARLPITLFPAQTWPDLQSPKQSSVTCLRSVLMKPEHLLWIDAIWARLQQSGEAALPRSETVLP